MASVAASVTADLVAALKLDVKTKSQLYRDAVSDSGVSADAVDAAKAALRDSLRELATAQEDDKAKASLPAVERVVSGGGDGDGNDAAAAAGSVHSARQRRRR